jgi:hypothetical protein
MEGECMASFVLISTFAVCLSTIGVLVAGGMPGAVVDALFFSGPLLLLGTYLFLVIRKKGLRDPGGLLAPLQVALLSAWIPYLLVLAALNLQYFSKVLTLEDLSEQTTIYLLLIPTYALSVVTGAIGFAATQYCAGSGQG